MNIFEQIGDSGESYYFEHLFSEDSLNDYELESLIKNKDVVLSYYENRNRELCTLDDFIDYLYVLKYANSAGVLPYVREDKREELEQILNALINIRDEYQVKDLIGYCTKKYIDLLSSKENYMDKALFEITLKYHNVCGDILDYLIDNRFYLIIRNFERLQNIVFADAGLCKKILEKKHFDNIKDCDLKHYLDVLTIFKEKRAVPELLDQAVSYVIEYGKSVYGKITDDTLIQYEFVCKDILDFLTEIKHTEAHAFRVKFESLVKVRKAYVKKHGHTVSIELPTDKTLKFLNDESIPFEIRFKHLTHCRTGNKTRSYFAIIGQIKDNPITDGFVYIANPHDDYFTMKKQMLLNIQQGIILSVISDSLKREKIQNTFSMLASILKEDCEGLGKDYEESGFDDDLNILLNMILCYFDAFDNKNEYLQTGMNYTMSMFIFGLIEKLLRFYYCSRQTDNYFKENWFSLGRLLDENNNLMVDLLGMDHIKILGYYLINGDNGKIGFNLRNRLAHHIYIKYEDIGWWLTAMALYIFIDITNEINLKIDSEKDVKK